LTGRAGRAAPEPAGKADPLAASTSKGGLTFMTNHDAEIEAICRVVQSDTNRSVKRTILACLLILATRRRMKFASVASLVGGVAIAHYCYPIARLLVH
jgi:hypothetical protein